MFTIGRGVDGSERVEYEMPGNLLKYRPSSK